jgi:hypothetical protein
MPASAEIFYSSSNGDRWELVSGVVAPKTSDGLSLVV